MAPHPTFESCLLLSLWELVNKYRFLNNCFVQILKFILSDCCYLYNHNVLWDITTVLQLETKTTVTTNDCQSLKLVSCFAMSSLHGS